MKGSRDNRNAEFGCGRRILSALLVFAVIFSSCTAFAMGSKDEIVLYEGDGMFQAGSFFGPQESARDEEAPAFFMLRAVGTSNEEALYREILSAMRSCDVRQVQYEKNGTIYSGNAVMLDIASYLYTKTNSSMDSVYYLYAKAVNSNPRYFYYIPNVLFTSSDGKLSEFYMMVNKKAYDQRDAYEAEITRMTAEAVPDASGMCETEIALAAHDYLVSHTAYDWEAYYSLNRYENYPDSFSAYGAIENKRAVCQGLSLAYMDILSRLGLQCAIVPSYTLGHAWNLVFADGKWYHTDITNAGNAGGTGGIKHDYFMLSDEESRAIHYGDWSSDGLVAAPDAHVSKPFWAGVESSMYYVGGYWYYNDGALGQQNNRCAGTLQKTRYAAQRLPESLFSNVSFPVRLGDELVFCNLSDNTLDFYNPINGQMKSRQTLAAGSLLGIEIGVASSGPMMPSGYLHYSDDRSNSGYFCYGGSLGDVDGNGSSNVLDLLLLENIKIGEIPSDALTDARADVDWNTAVNDKDCDYLSRFIIGIMKNLPKI